MLILIVVFACHEIPQKGVNEISRNTIFSALHCWKILESAMNKHPNFRYLDKKEGLVGYFSDYCENFPELLSTPLHRNDSASWSGEAAPLLKAKTEYIFKSEVINLVQRSAVFRRSWSVSTLWCIHNLSFAMQNLPQPWTLSPQVRQRILAAIGTSGPFSNTQVESKDKLVTCQANNTNIRLTKVENEIKTLKTISL